MKSISITFRPDPETEARILQVMYARNIDRSKAIRLIITSSVELDAHARDVAAYGRKRKENKA